MFFSECLKILQSTLTPQLHANQGKLFAIWHAEGLEL